MGDPSGMLTCRLRLILALRLPSGVECHRELLGVLPSALGLRLLYMALGSLGLGFC